MRVEPSDTLSGPTAERIAELRRMSDEANALDGPEIVHGKHCCYWHSATRELLAAIAERDAEISRFCVIETALRSSLRIAESELMERDRRIAELELRVAQMESAIAKHYREGHDL